ncbi:MAG: FkbM family methyltransferase [Planctomycetes bacterium]|nr:FkbM family methyltransferase [Planctomycetota bacterium]
MAIKRFLRPRTRWLQFRSDAREVGLSAALRVRLHRVRFRLGLAGREFTLTDPAARHRLRCRASTSDLAVFRQVFRDREYGCVDGFKSVSLVVDCGANVGYSSAYFLSRFPACDLIAIEPDPENHALLVKNIAPYGGRARAVRAGVWSHPCRLTISEAAYRDGEEWSRQVRECRPDEKSDLEAVGIADLLAKSGHDRISILKVDIEGAEGVLFSEGCVRWLDRVDCIVIELHDDSVFGRCTDIFFNAIKGRGFDVSRSGELTVCRRTGKS